MSNFSLRNSANEPFTARASPGAVRDIHIAGSGPRTVARKTVRDSGPRQDANFVACARTADGFERRNRHHRVAHPIRRAHENFHRAAPAFPRRIASVTALTKCLRQLQTKSGSNTPACAVN